MVRAIWNDTVIANSDATVVVEGTHYFPQEHVSAEHLQPSPTQTVCHWKGVATYYSIVIGNDVNKDAAWVYVDPKEAAASIRGCVAFWKGVEIIE